MTEMDLPESANLSPSFISRLLREAGLPAEVSKIRVDAWVIGAQVVAPDLAACAEVIRAAGYGTVRAGRGLIVRKAVPPPRPTDGTQRVDGGYLYRGHFIRKRPGPPRHWKRERWDIHIGENSDCDRIPNEVRRLLDAKAIVDRTLDALHPPVGD